MGWDLGELWSRGGEMNYPHVGESLDEKGGECEKSEGDVTSHGGGREWS